MHVKTTRKVELTTRQIEFLTRAASGAPLSAENATLVKLLESAEAIVLHVMDTERFGR